ncbi:MAG: gamma-glutamylcyclotransferase [Candidatus Puniceispirillum sp.]
MTDRQKTAPITRETLADWRVATLARERDGQNATVASEEALLKSRRSLLADDADCRDIWVFGYGSLICNPVIAVEKQVMARAHGYHRRFCLWTQIGRGSPDCPGLVLSLDRGGSCVGVAFKLPADRAIAELDLLWRREMLTLSYHARWIPLHTAEGPKTAIAFVADRDRPAYAPPMPFDHLVNVVATAEGFNGFCRDYLFDTLGGMRNCGIRDRSMEKLARAVVERLASAE